MTNEQDDAYCERIRLLLSLAIDDEATPEQAAEISAHLPDCARCAESSEIFTTSSKPRRASSSTGGPTRSSCSPSRGPTSAGTSTRTSSIV